MRIMVAGATGAIGRRFVELAREAGHNMRALTRQPGREQIADEVVVGDALDRESLNGIGEDVDIFVSALGASVGLTLAGRATYDDIDVPANLNLLDVAKTEGVQRFVYVGVATGPGYDHTRYMRAHERVCDALKDSGLSVTIIRPTGVFTALEEFLGMARFGVAQVIGDGSAKTNPVHPVDVAEAMFAHLEAGPVDIPVGGPEVLTRRGIAEAAFEALGKKPRVIGSPAFTPKIMSKLMRPLHPRLGDLVEFAAAVSTVDAVADQVGTRRLVDYYRELAGRSEAKQLGP